MKMILFHRMKMFELHMLLHYQRYYAVYVILCVIVYSLNILNFYNYHLGLFVPQIDLQNSILNHHNPVMGPDAPHVTHVPILQMSMQLSNTTPYVL